MFNLNLLLSSGVASSISEGDIFIYSCSAQLISFETDSISKEINHAEHEYMNMSPPLIKLATSLLLSKLVKKSCNYAMREESVFFNR